jgi:hypothetical protein
MGLAVLPPLNASVAAPRRRTASRSRNAIRSAAVRLGSALTTICTIVSLASGNRAQVPVELCQSEMERAAAGVLQKGHVMKSRCFAAVSVAALVLAACGGDDDGGSGPQSEVADMVIEDMKAEGFVVDEDCVRDAVGELSDDDAQALVDAGPEGDAGDLGADAAEAAAEVAGCIDADEMIDAVVDDMVAEMGEENVDADCIKEALEGVDLATVDGSDPAVMTAVLDCVQIGG